MQTLAAAIEAARKRKRRAAPEHVLQVAVAGYLRVALKPPTVWSTIPSGGGGRVRGAQLKAAGLQRGLPDILVMHPAPNGQGPIVIGLELKAKRGRISPEQRTMLRAFHDCRAWYVLCRSLDEVAGTLEWCKVPLHARPA